MNIREFFQNRIFMIKVICGLLISYGVTMYVGPFFFIDNTPALQPNLSYEVISIVNKIGLKNKQVEEDILQWNREQIAQMNIRKLQQEVSSKPFITLTKGTYAKESESGTVVKVVIDEIPMLEYKFMIDGKEVVVQVPEGEIPPSQQEAEQAYDLLNSID